MSGLTLVQPLEPRRLLSTAFPADGAPPAPSAILAAGVASMPVPPVDLVGVARGGTVRLAFTDRSTDETAFVLERADVRADGTLRPYEPVRTAPPSAAGESGGRIFVVDGERGGLTSAYRVRAVSAIGTSDPSNEVRVTPTYDAPFVGTHVFLYNDRVSAGQPVVTQLLPFTRADFGSGSPHTSVGADNFSGRWEGYLFAELSERYTFHTASADGIALRLVDPRDSRVLIDFDNLNAVREMPPAGFQDVAGTAQLERGVSYLLTVRFNDATGEAGYRVGWSSFSTPLEIIPDNLISPALPGGPKVDDAWMASTQWSDSFKSRLPGRSGFPVASLPSGDLPRPWANLNEISIAFTAPVNVDRGDLRVRGVNVAEYTVADFQYDPGRAVATWTLQSPLGADRVTLHLASGGAGGGVVGTTDGGRALDGEWPGLRELGVSGNGIPGGDFIFRFDVLPGDVNRDGRVLADDFSAVKKKFFSTPANPGSGDAAYSVFHDVDGSGSILASDFSEVKKRFFSRLPDPPPAAVASASLARPALRRPATRTFFDGTPLLA